MASQIQDPKIVFDEPQSSKKGVFLHMAKFQSKNKDEMPFKGGKFIVGPQKTSSLDNHQVKECWMVAQGSGLLYYNKKEFEIKEGDFLYYESFNEHQVYNPSETQDLIIYTVWW